MRKYHLWCRQMLFVWTNYAPSNKENFCLLVGSISRGRCLLGVEISSHLFAHVLGQHIWCFHKRQNRWLPLRIIFFPLLQGISCIWEPQTSFLPFLLPWPCYPGKNWKVQATTISNWEKGTHRKVNFTSVVREHGQCGNWVHSGKDSSLSK